MDGRGGCCIARYGGTGGYDMSQVDRIMLRFRPIAPKPPTLGTDSSPKANLQASPRTGGGKRRSHNCNGKFNGVKRCNNSNKKRKSSWSSSEGKTAAMTTLPLLPDTPARGSLPLDDHFLKPKNFPMWLSFSDNYENNHINRHVAASGGLDRVVGSCVTVECVTDAWMEEKGGGVGSKDEERRASLERDTCPGFVCDGFGRVTWTNDAYKKMVREGGGWGSGGEVVVWLVTKDRVPVMVTLATCHEAFTCRVRVEYGSTCGKETLFSKSVTVPCDVWRMDGGGFAWRLDVDVALRLGW